MTQPHENPCNLASPSAAEIAQVDAVVAACRDRVDFMLAVLHGLQDAFRCLPDWALHRVCRTTELRPAAVAMFAAFFERFRRLPAGAHMVSVCTGTTCHVKGAPAVYEAFRRYLHVPDDGDTDPDLRFTVQQVACLGCCTLAPAVQIDDVTYGHLTPDKVGRVIDAFLETRRRSAGQDSDHAAPRDSRQMVEIRIGLDSCCCARGCDTVYDAFAQAIRRSGAAARLIPVGCIGICAETPVVEIRRPDGLSAYYGQVRPEDVDGILARHAPPRSWPRRMPAATSHVLDEAILPGRRAAVRQRQLRPEEPRVAAFFGPQRHLAMAGMGELDPADLDGYEEMGGFDAWRQCLADWSGPRIIDEIDRSGLRGRGGGGYPTGRKWRAVRDAAGAERFVICNGDEGDPGAFMDRMLLESFPFRVIEGLALAAYAVGAHRAWFYVRHEYPLARQRVQAALQLCRQRGYLGENIFSSGYGLEIDIICGGGAFVCGEESALIASIEGPRPTPRLRPPYPSEVGLLGCPTLINNVETLASVPWIIRHGAAEFAAMGTAHSAGSKVFALAGQVIRPGLIEVPFGVTLGQVVYDIGGGMNPGRSLKAVQIGGPSGACLPATMADLPIAYETLAEAGAIMGSGGLVILDDTDCMVELARYFLEFTQRQSCGKCTFCRVGTGQALDILTALCAGRARPADITVLEDLCRQIADGSLCGLGQTAPNPVTSTLRYFRAEYQAHLEGRCPAGKCAALVSYYITEDCIGCSLCARQCPVEAIEARPYMRHQVDDDLCVRCGVCRAACPMDAIEVISPRRDR